MKEFAVLVLAMTFIMVVPGCGNDLTGYTTITGIYAESGLGDSVIIREINGKTQYIFLNDSSDHANLFDTLEAGDRIEIKIVMIDESDEVLRTNVFDCQKLTATFTKLPETHLENIDFLAKTIH